MLKYEINIDKLKDNTFELDVKSIEIEDSILNNQTYDIKVYYDNYDLKYGEEIEFIHNFYPIIKPSDSNGDILNRNNEPFSITYSKSIINLNNVDSYFQYSLNKWIMIDKLGRIIVNEEDNNIYWYFYFEEKNVGYYPHHFFEDDPNFDSNGKFDIMIYMSKLGFDKSPIIKCEYVNGSCFRWKYDLNIENIDLIIETLFSLNTYNMVDEIYADAVEYNTIPSNVNYYSPEHIKIIKNYDDNNNPIYKYFEKKYLGTNINNIKLYRLNCCYKSNDNYKLVITKTILNVPIKLEQNLALNLESVENINEYFFESETNNAINPIIEMEKNIYYPAIYDSNSGEYKLVKKIKFNLHFRQHRGDNWITDDYSYWNGCDNNNKRLYNTVNSNINPYFSYPNNKISEQSDLLTFLNFTNKDVKYHKNKIKKSFLRLSYYNSVNQSNNYLLDTSTVFMNSGELYKKYIGNILKKAYTNTTIDNNYDIFRNLTGSYVDREPYGELINNYRDTDDIEKLRLSSQFLILDKYDSTNSSEGFCIYLWQDNANGAVAQDIFLKVEFSHAGYGRTIPFMMPFKDENMPGFKKIKTFSDIMTDWREGSGYGIKKYTKYSYIHFKCKFDINNKKYIYYLDPEFYGNCVNYNNEDRDELIINLYEAKVTF